MTQYTTRPVFPRPAFATEPRVKQDTSERPQVQYQSNRPGPCCLSGLGAERLMDDMAVERPAAGATASRIDLNSQAPPRGLEPRSLG
jgi:hypothetical protein